MAGAPGWRRILDKVLSIGSYPGEPETQGGGRRVLVAAMVVGALLNIPTVVGDFSAGYTLVAGANLAIVVGTPIFLDALRRWPHRLAWIINGFFVLVLAVQLVEATVYGGLLESGLVVLFGLVFSLGALVAISLRAAVWWFVVFVASVVYSIAIPRLVEPIYELADPTADAAFNLVATGVLVIAVLAYFVRQRDRFQQRSDDLLHNILPNEIADRLKDGRAMIADDFRAASVLFADVVNFTPMSEGMAPAELVGLLNDVFTRFDELVDELGLEKIKTVGDEYMAAAGVPRPRADHAPAIAELAVRIRDHVATSEVAGRRLSLRIGINSGPVTAGIIGTHKFAYDLWATP
ncbi:MAG TPA: adenylate/guanylate cyclase domain-containing protein [Actinomycetes bacterium]|nr:adenylate/guanylate cyclase domain-containing protein [Actinomycetes bacterium]